MEAVSDHLREAPSLCVGSPSEPPSPPCTCCWPLKAFESAAALLREIEELCSQQAQDNGPAAAGSASVLQSNGVSKQQQDAASCTRPFAGLLLEAVELLVDVLRIFGPKQVVLSFNGGKDAVVILHLYRAALVKYTRLQQQEAQQQQQQTNWSRCSPARVATPRAVYFHAGPQEFAEVEAFVQRTAEEFSLSVETYYCDWATGLRSFLLRHPKTPVAFVLGTRLSDPQGARETLAFLQPSSRWLPPFLRVQPLLHFEYGHIWTFLRRLRLPYCSLYDQGYSSIGTKANTQPNPLLAKNDGTQPLPAYELRLWDKEREGRRSHRPDASGH
ncbi:hypothetical protein Efla_001526 [Eimeria flavescens]